MVARLTCLRRFTLSGVRHLAMEEDQGSTEAPPFVDLLAAAPPPNAALPSVVPDTHSAAPSATAPANEAVSEEPLDDDKGTTSLSDAAPTPLPPAPSVPPPLPPTVADAVRSTAAEIISTDDENSRSEALEDIVLRSTTPRASSASAPSGATSLAATVEIIEHAGTVGDLQALLQQSCGSLGCCSAAEPLPRVPAPCAEELHFRGSPFSFGGSLRRLPPGREQLPWRCCTRSAAAPAAGSCSWA